MSARLARPRLCSAAGLALLGVALLLAYGVAQLAGLRQHTSVLIGSAAAGGAPDVGDLARGLLFGAAYLGAVGAAPMLLLGAVIHAGLTMVAGPDDKERGSNGS